MLKASALYIVIIIALVIAVLCSSLIVSAYYYKLQFQKKFRYDQLETDLNSGVSILLASNTEAYKNERSFALFGKETDSVSLKRTPWGIYDVAECRAFIQGDTLKKAFSIANQIDSAKWAAVYLIDEDRPLSVSGKTMIRGNAFIPKAGVKEAYVDGKAYQGDKRLVIGNKHDSQRSLPELQQNRLKYLEDLKSYKSTDSSFHHADSIGNSFFKPTIVINFKKRVQTISNIKLNGNIIILSDTTVFIEKTANISELIIYARAISVQPGFKGRCQLFASDSIGIQKDCVLEYPSCIGVLRSKPDKGMQARIHAGENVSINGCIFTYEKEKGQLQPLIDLGKNVKISGQVYSQGLVRFKEGGSVDGSVFTNRFLYQTTYTTFENYLINTRLDVRGLSPYYLTSSLFPVSDKKQNILQWLGTN